MATSIYFNGRRTSIPGSYSKIDATGLEQVGFGAIGVVAILGTAQGGRPMSAVTKTDDLIRINRAGQEGEIFRSGDLLEAIPIAFAPSADENVPGGAAQVIACKVNPATQSAAVLTNAYGDCVDLTSADYGAHTQQINVAIASGTTQGKLITIVFEDTSEVGDNVGGDDIFHLTYEHAAAGAWEAMTTAVLSTGIEAYGTKSDPGLDGDVTTLAAPAKVEVLSSNAGDTSQVVDIFGLASPGGTPVRERLALTGTTPVVSTTTFLTDSVWAMEITGTTAGTVTCRVESGGATILSAVAGANPIKGATRAVGMYVGGGVVTLVAGAATTQKVILAGYADTGAYQLEVLTLAGTTPVVGTAKWSRLTTLVMGHVAAASTVTFSATAAKTLNTTQNTLQKVADTFNGKWEGGNGFVLVLDTARVDMAPSELDVSPSAVDVFATANPVFKADLQAVVDWINDNSAYVLAAKSSGAEGGAPSNTASPVYLVGGVEGTATRSDYLAALDFLKKVSLNTIVVLTGDPSVHADLEAHCAYMCGQGRNERDGVVGLLNTGLTDVPSKSEIKSQLRALNSRHIRAVAEAVERYNREGVRTEYAPPFFAVAIAGLQAGAPIGEPLTWKYVDVLDVRCDSSWSQVDDAEEMLSAGLLFTERVDGQGFRIMRNLTTYTRTNNLAFIEASTNQAANYATQQFRTALEIEVGKKGVGRSLAALHTVAEAILNRQVEDETLVEWRNLKMSRVADGVSVSVQMAPVTPNNFITSTIHLVTVTLTA